MADIKLIVISYEDKETGVYKYLFTSKRKETESLQRFIKETHIDPKIKVEAREIDVPAYQEKTWGSDYSSNPIFIVKCWPNMIYVFSPIAGFDRSLVGILDYLRCWGPGASKNLFRIEQISVFEKYIGRPIEIESHCWEGDSDTFLSMDEMYL